MEKEGVKMRDGESVCVEVLMVNESEMKEMLGIFSVVQAILTVLILYGRV